MKHIATFILCFVLVWATPLPKSPLKKVPAKDIVLRLVALPVCLNVVTHVTIDFWFGTRPNIEAISEGDATGLRGTFPSHPRPFHLTFTDIHNNIYTPMGAFPDGTRTRADPAVVAERVLILPSTTLPSAPRRHTYTSMARRRFLPLKKSSPFGGIRTH
ncbi:hypothetical protein GEV33_003577 [Tenebrio molitor]|uniref:Uncharacterized protein n=1 Tax=Tenebrio molitor TaxID=7067 RepID=A0A8J6HR68_TENMO|nr:hypothetical protein GEV33_003577 [Tenebrio molitor]